jgi:hypothetical protein
MIAEYWESTGDSEVGEGTLLPSDSDQHDFLTKDTSDHRMAHIADFEASDFETALAFYKSVRDTDEFLDRAEQAAKTGQVLKYTVPEPPCL